MTIGNKILVLDRLPGQVTPLGEWLHGAVDRVALVTSTESAPDYQGEFSPLVSVDDYNHGDGVERAAGQLLAAGGFDSVVHLIEDDILRAARLRAAYGIKGMTVDEALPYRDKAVMKQHVAAAGLGCPAFTVPAGAADVERFAAAYGWPVVVKPRLSSGSQGVTVVRDPDAAHRALRGLPADDVMVEQFVPGPVYHVDGAVHEGRILLAVASRYVNDCMAFHDAQPLGSAQLDPDDAEASALRAFAQQVVDALPPVDFSPFHLEVFRHADSGEFVFCEIACRMGGAHVMEATTYAVGLNVARLHVRHQVGLEYGPGVPLRQGGRRYGWLIVPPRVGTLEAVREPSGMPWVKDFYVKTAVPKTFGTARWSTDSYLGVVVEGRDHDEVAERLNIFAAAVDELTTWRTPG